MGQSTRAGRRKSVSVTRLVPFGNADDAEVMRSFEYHGAEQVRRLLPLLVHKEHRHFIFHGTHEIPSSAEEARLPRRRIGFDLS